ncbi:DUF1987 domain-containing protein [Noviherbaspirillum sedimenti]|uniref:DUF1987 domain-containing protein n=1 Tax=Noviherbaspirillum sedimenti TaxID=2320865 RepID=A0A3A3G5Y8_9BURK|nr:DUF1987 domain-containing protein [Noviherbaspirillum sedimenti]RJG01932.1 DUF1987 domain-containing protein [Noviherbaspirillum sedimenti]
MQAIKTVRTDSTPEVIFNPVHNTLFIAGECYPENPNLFFQPIIGTMQAHFDNKVSAKFYARIRLSYVNSASTKSMRQLFMVLNEAAHAGCAVDIDWEFDEEDDAIQDLGEDLMHGLGVTWLNFNEAPFVA